MFWIGLISILIWVITSFIIIADIIKKNTPLGCLGLFLFPIMPFIWVVKWYSGNKKLMVPLLFSSAIIGFSSIYFSFTQANKILSPLLDAAKKEVNLECGLNTIRIAGSKQYILTCNSPESTDIKYGDIQQLVDNYKEKFIVPIASYYPKKLIPEKNTVIIFGIQNPSGITACIQLDSPGTISRAWHSGTEDMCEN